MITQIKNWLRRLWAWVRGDESAEDAYSPVTSSLNIGTTQEGQGQATAPTASAIEGVTPQTGSSPRLSTVENWQEPVGQPTLPPANERKEITSPIPPPTEKIRETSAPINTGGEAPALALPPSSSPQQQLEFLRYLVKRGIVNEGFVEGHVPEQYRRNMSG